MRYNYIYNTYKFIGGLKIWFAVGFATIAVLALLVSFQKATSFFNNYVFFFSLPGIIFLQIIPIYYLGPLLARGVEIQKDRIVFYLLRRFKYLVSYHYCPEVSLKSIERVETKDTYLRVLANGRKYIFPRFLIDEKKDIVDLSLFIKPQS